MKRSKISDKTIVTIAILGFVILVALWFIIGIIQLNKSEYVYSLDSGWNVYINGQQVYEQSSICDVNFGTLHKGDEVDMVIDLPDELNGGYTLDILVYLCSLDAYVGDEQIYSYGHEYIDSDTMCGSGYHFISLPDDVSNKQLTLHMIMNEENAFTSIVTPKVAKTNVALIAFARSQMINCFTCIFLILLGLLLTIFASIATIFDRIYSRLIYIGLFSGFIGAWSFASNKVAEIFTTDLLFVTEVEYISLYLAPIPFAFLMYNMRRLDSTWRRTVLKIICGVLSSFGVVTIVLHYANIIRFPSVLSAFHIIGFASILFISFAGYISVKDKTSAESITAMAMILLLVVLAMDIGRFNLQKYILPNNDILMNSFIPLGAMVFVIMLLVSYLIYLYDMVMTKAEKDTLLKMAYHDELTGLYNRAKYEEKIEELESSVDDFAIISLDLNGLKETNDKYGHSSGDTLLENFAKIITKDFKPLGNCYRIGGDEFAVIVDDLKIGNITDALVSLNMDEKDMSKMFDFDIQASYGIAYRSEDVMGKASNVAKIADKRMYEMKSQVQGQLYSFAKVNPR